MSYFWSLGTMSVVNNLDYFIPFSFSLKMNLNGNKLLFNSAPPHTDTLSMGRMWKRWKVYCWKWSTDFKELLPFISFHKKVKAGGKRQTSSIYGLYACVGIVYICVYLGWYRMNVINHGLKILPQEPGLAVLHSCIMEKHMKWLTGRQEEYQL